MEDDSLSETGFRTARLVSELRAGSDARFDELYARVAPSLCAWAMLRIRPVLRPHLEPQDVVQEVWMRALRSFETYDERLAPFRAWVTGIAKNVMLEAFQKLRTLPLGVGVMGSTSRFFMLDGCPDRISSITTRLVRDESVLRLVEFVERASPEDRRIFLHCGLEAIPHAEVATLLGMTEAAVTKRWQRLRARLREAGSFADLLPESEA